MPTRPGEHHKNFKYKHPNFIGLSAGDYNRYLRLYRKYNMTIDDYNQMFDNQEGKCKICGTHKLELKRRLSVDHCHKTGKIRGLLCSNCNHGLGSFKDSVSFLENAINYLKSKD